MKLTEIKSKSRTVADLNIKYNGVGGFDCSSNQLTSLEGAPSSIGGSFSCRYNQLTSLQGAPSSIDGSFYCMDNKLTSLEGIHKQIKYVKSTFLAYKNPIKSHVLGLLLIKEITFIDLDNGQVKSILNKHLPSRGMVDVLEAQEELLDIGLDEFAQL